jgi:hypothetical protein
VFNRVGVTFSSGVTRVLEWEIILRIAATWSYARSGVGDYTTDCGNLELRAFWRGRLYYGLRQPGVTRILEWQIILRIAATPGIVILLGSYREPAIHFLTGHHFSVHMLLI